MDINLLPWRVEIIAYNKKILIGMLGAVALVAAVFLLLAYNVIFEVVNYNSAYAEALKSANKRLVAKVKRHQKYKESYKSVHERVLALEKMQHSRYTTVQLFNEITKITPKGIFLNKMERKDERVGISGIANSNLLISQLLKSIDDSDDLKNISLREVEKKEGKQTSIILFHINLAIKSPYSLVDKQEKKTKSKKAGKNTFDKTLESQKK